MSEKRFDIAYGGNVITDEDGRDLDLTVKWCVEELVDKLNEQQATIDKLDQENADLLGARIKAQEEWEKCTDKLKEKIVEQQATITRLEEENEQLRQQLQDWDDMVELATKTSLRNVELDEQNGQLRKELNDCEKFRYTVFKRMGELNDE